MTHDPLCPLFDKARYPFSAKCDCDLIARVREEERSYAKQTAAAVMAYGEGKRDGYAAALRDAVEAVKALRDYKAWGILAKAVATIEALGGTA